AGRADSGEVEDHSIAIYPAVRVNKVLTDGGFRTFDLAIDGVVVASGVGDGGTSGTRTVFHTSAFGAPDVTVPQNVATTAIPLTITERQPTNVGLYQSSWVCVDGTGATVASGPFQSASVTIPASTAGNGRAQNLTCTFTNRPLPVAQMTHTIRADADTNGSGRLDAGDVVTHSYAVTNTGEIPLFSLSVTDTVVTGITCPSTDIAVGATVVCTGTHTLTQAEVDAGNHNSIATARVDSVNDGATIPNVGAGLPIAGAPAVELTKTASPVVDANGTGRTDPGDTIEYGFTVTNTGNAALRGTVVEDPLAGEVSCPPPATVIGPGQSLTCTAAPYAITQVDVDGGAVTNTARATALDPSGNAVTSDPSSTRTPLDQVYRLELSKNTVARDVDGDGDIGLGDEIDYAFEVANTGTTTVADVTVDDPGLPAPVVCPTPPLAPGSSITCTAADPWVVTQADVNTGYHANLATARGRSLGFDVNVTSPEVFVRTPVDRTPEVSLTKDGSLNDLDGNGPDAGDTIDYTFVVTNTGTTEFRPGALVDDPLVGDLSCPPYGSGACTYDVGSITCADYGPFLEPGESTTCSADAPYTVTQGDVDAGEVRNTAVAQVDDSWVDT
ncbi:MAG: DUF7507 domain-containing protein, partial [Phycicoccus sp.]